MQYWNNTGVEYQPGLRCCKGAFHTGAHSALTLIPRERHYCSQDADESEAGPGIQIQACCSGAPRGDLTGITSVLKELTISCENKPHLYRYKVKQSIAIFLKLDLLVLGEKLLGTSNVDLLL